MNSFTFDDLFLLRPEIRTTTEKNDTASYDTQTYFLHVTQRKSVKRATVLGIATYYANVISKEKLCDRQC